MRTRRLVERRGVRRFIPASNAIVAVTRHHRAGRGHGRGGRRRPDRRRRLRTEPPAAAPSIAGISPDFGPARGGTRVVISGTGLAKASVVRFGTRRVRRINVANGSQLVVKAPPGSGTVDVTVVTPKGRSADSAVDRFTYTTGSSPPAVSRISPASGKPSGDPVVTITARSRRSHRGRLGGEPAADLSRAATPRFKPRTPAARARWA